MHRDSIEEDVPMEYGRIQYVDKPISRIVFGTATAKLFAAFRSVYGNAPDFAERHQAAFELLDMAYAHGINCFDCANHYGEEPLGEWIEARGLRDKVVILDKCAHHSMWRKRVTDFDILYDAHDALAKLRTDHIDIYMLHRDDPTVSVGPIIDVFNRLHDEGKVGAFGTSNWTIQRIEEANEYAAKCGLIPFTVNSPNFGLADQVNDPWGGGCVTISGPANSGVRRWHVQHGMPVFAYSPLARGFFSGKLTSAHPEDAVNLMDEAGVKGYCDPANFRRLERCEALAKEKNVSVPLIAMAYIFSQPGLDVYALTGSTKPENIRMNIDALSLKLTEAECKWLDLESDAR